MTQYSGVFTLQQQGQALTSGQWCTDPYFKNTTLLLHADGVAGGAQNNTFLDSSTNGFAITRNGNTTQGSFTPYGPTWSNYFDASSRFSCDRAAASFGTNSFTIECWWLAAGSQTNYAGLVAQNFSSTNGGWALKVNNGSNVVEFSYINSTPQNIVASVNVNDGAWHHLAITRSGTSLYMYVDGILQTTGTLPSAFSFSSGGGNTDIGYQARDNAYIKGYVSNLRLVNGTALSTGSTYSVSTTPLTAVTNTSLLVCQSNRFIDNSSNAYALTVAAGTPSVQRFSPFAPQYQYTPDVIGGSGYFDGTTDFLTVSKNTALEPATSGAWCLETWVYATSNTAGNLRIIAYANASVASGPDLGYYMNLYPGTSINAGFYSGGSDYNIASTSAVTAINTWTHIALTSDGTTMRLFVNGVSVGTPLTVTGVSINAPSAALFKVGNYSSSQYLYGYTSDTRFVKGSAVYTTTFTPPTTPLTAITNTSLLLNYTNAGIYDNAMMNDLETVGDAQVSTSVVKYGSGSMYFDGTGDYLKVLGNPSFNFGTGDFTIECWIYPQGSGNRRFVDYSNGTASNSNFEFDLRVTSGNAIYASAFSGSTEYAITSSTTYSNVWVHVAFVRSSSTLTLYLNGVSAGTSSIGTSATNTLSSAILSISSYYGGSGELYQGYIDDLRITKGVARYTANFQPPKVAFANQ